jgi:chemotaxis protein histidine kinase CheA
VLIDLETGEVVLAMVEFGGFLGLGTNVVPIPMNVLEWSPEFSTLVADIPEETLDEAPTVGETWPDPADAAWVDEAAAALQALGLESPTDLSTLVGRSLSAERMQDLDIQNTAGEDIGDIDDVLVDLSNQQASYAIVSFSGLGDRSAVPLTAFQFAGEAGDVVAVLDVAAEQLTTAPIFNPAEIDFNAPDWDAELRSFWGVEEAVEEAAAEVEAEAEEVEAEAEAEVEEAETEVAEETEAQVSATEVATSTAEVSPTMGISVTETEDMYVITLETTGPFQILIQVVSTGGLGPSTEVETVPADEATPEAEEEATPEATEEATPEATEEATPEATEEATPEAEEEATPEATEEATPEAGEEATPEAEQTPTPSS